MMSEAAYNMLTCYMPLLLALHRSVLVECSTWDEWSSYIYMYC